MYHFEIEQKNTENSKALLLTEEEDNKNKNLTEHKHHYLLIFPHRENSVKDLEPQLCIWVGLQMTHWVNTVGKTKSFKEAIRQFEWCCNQALKLKV